MVTFLCRYVVKINALETDYIGDTGPYPHTEFARRLWLENEKMTDDRFETSSQEEEVGVLIGVDEMFELDPKKKHTKKGKEIIPQMLQCCSFTTARTVSSYGTECYNPEGIFTKFPDKEEPTAGEKETTRTLSPQPMSVIDMGTQKVKPHGRKFNHRATELQIEQKNTETRERKTKKSNRLRLITVLEAGTLRHPRRLQCCRAGRPNRLFWRKYHLSKRRAILHPNPMENRQVVVRKEFPHSKRETGKSINKTKKTPELLTAYHQHIEQLRLHKFVEEADLDYGGLHTYLPHHPVIQQDKSTTKIRLKTSTLTISNIQETIEGEARSKTITVSAAITKPANPMEWQLEHIPSWNRLLPRTAWILRFISRRNQTASRTRLKIPVKIGDGREIMVEHLTVEELTRAELCIYRQFQKEKYPKSFQDLQGIGNHTPKKQLTSSDPNIEPAILLPAHNPVVKLIIQDRHVSLKHAGVKTTLSDLREKFWVVNERLQTKIVWHACVKCQRQSSPSFREVAAPLPLNCLKQAKAFEITGVDFAGPLYYKHPASPPTTKAPTTEAKEEIQENLQTDESATKKKGSIKQTKSYACLLNCGVTRAVHLELTKIMSARDFLLAFRRFSAMRGNVSIIYSDNAQTFRCISNHLKVLRSDPSIHDLLAMCKTELGFSASLAPWLPVTNRQIPLQGRFRALNADRRSCRHPQ
ncbi:Uncharacterized protein APZ42_029729 [Daphnia magna]|uniref:Integrase zinc-binding domain-containing protein n=1 Tax=Daphnia magna TaxID=35525 RepID=A0A164PD23_9CRUS|nr:Uncharacterized protein APZ42_029729 [Daphnia magna]